MNASSELGALKYRLKYLGRHPGGIYQWYGDTLHWHIAGRTWLYSRGEWRRVRRSEIKRWLYDWFVSYPLGFIIWILGCAFAGAVTFGPPVLLALWLSGEL